MFISNRFSFHRKQLVNLRLEVSDMLLVNTRKVNTKTESLDDMRRSLIVSDRNVLS